MSYMSATKRDCWCGNSKFVLFGPDYSLCMSCQTLVCRHGLSDQEVLVKNDDEDFYGKQYWLNHQQQDMGYPDIHVRSRSDLAERNLHWLKALLKYRLPPAKIMELGCGNGSFVALLQKTGFEVFGVEMSPWVVSYAKQTFDIQVERGPFESLTLAPQTLDVIVLMDVLEHLPDPLLTMSRCIDALKPDGLMLIQTPEFKIGSKYDELLASGNPFLEQLKSDEHIYLFSQQSVKEIMGRLGCGEVSFLPAIFDHYDMFLAVSKKPLCPISNEEVESALLATSDGRLTLAMLDLRERELNTLRMFEESESDRISRGNQIESLTAMLKASEIDREDRFQQIENLTKIINEYRDNESPGRKQLSVLNSKLREQEIDRIERGKQIETLTRMLHEVKLDNVERGKQIETLTRMFQESESDRIQRGLQIEELTTLLHQSELDRDVRGQSLETLTKENSKKQSEIVEQAHQIEALNSLLANFRARGNGEEDEKKELVITSDDFNQFEDERGGSSRESGVNNCSGQDDAEEVLTSESQNYLDNHSLDETHQSSFLHTVAIDLTPILPGGENGGAKIFILELIIHMGRLHPETQFVLLTASVSHDELEFLDSPNIRRHLTVERGGSVEKGRQFAGDLKRIIHKHLPRRIGLLTGIIESRIKREIRSRSHGIPLREVNADLLFCPFTASTYSVAGIPTVCTIHDLQYKTYPEFFSTEDVIHRDISFMDACKNATLLAAVSDYARNSAIIHGRLEPSRIRTIHHRLAQRVSHNLADESGLLERLGVTANSYLVYPANFWRHKNHEMLLTAFGVACNSGLGPDIKLVCTGAPGVRREWLLEAVRSMKISDRVLFPGFLSNSDLAALIRHSSGVVFPSLYEGFGMPVLEAMALGVPVACSNTTSLPEIAADAAIFFDPRLPIQMASAIVAVVNDDKLRKRLVASGNNRIADFSDPNRMAEEYWNLFLEAVSRRKEKTRVTGVYADGWMGSSMDLLIAPDKQTSTLEIEFLLPEWSPLDNVSLQIYKDGKLSDESLMVGRGMTVNWTTPVGLNGINLGFKSESFFVPSLSGENYDDRQLSLIVQGCVLILSDDKKINLLQC